MNKIYSKETNQKYIYIYIHTYIQGHIHIPIYIYFRQKLNKAKTANRQENVLVKVYLEQRNCHNSLKRLYIYNQTKNNNYQNKNNSKKSLIVTKVVYFL